MIYTVYYHLMINNSTAKTVFAHCCQPKCADFACFYGYEMCELDFECRKLKYILFSIDF